MSFQGPDTAYIDQAFAQLSERLKTPVPQYVMGQNSLKVCGPNAVACYDTDTDIVYFPFVPTIGTVAHEFGHAVHDHYGIMANTPQYETFADFIEEWYVKSRHLTKACHNCGTVAPMMRTGIYGKCLKCNTPHRQTMSTYQVGQYQFTEVPKKRTLSCPACKASLEAGDTMLNQDGSEFLFCRNCGAVHKKVFRQGALSPKAILVGGTITAIAGGILTLAVAGRFPPKTKEDGITLTRGVVVGLAVGLFASLVVASIQGTADVTEAKSLNQKSLPYYVETGAVANDGFAK